MEKQNSPSILFIGQGPPNDKQVQKAVVIKIEKLCVQAGNAIQELKGPVGAFVFFKFAFAGIREQLIPSTFEIRDEQVRKSIVVIVTDCYGARTPG